MDERNVLLAKLLIEGHINVPERLILGAVTREEVKHLLKALLSAEGSFPKLNEGRAIYEGATLALTAAGAEITWTRAYPWDPFTLAEKAAKTFLEGDAAIDAFIDSEWSKGIDGVRLL